ncbi:hypothetical protein B5M42_017470 [Paenibacillus athensensis]|uniref:Uncharacterized protein n=1 Tax=Paenibacillus athensensis TaxID=1967502 RepID=A0A4Y8PWF6_9BACL|nr:hypothetical protein [Paenibacillus athensensis]MCD1260595.1 hypothetical protein [Paenibacillus athensensis]
MGRNIVYKRSRRKAAYLSLLGTTQLHLRNPWIVAWWSCAFPGFGHLLLSKYLRGFVLIGWELLINSQAGINEAMVYSFTGQFDLVKQVLDVRWMSLYAPVYLFAIYDSYRTTIDLNHVYMLANREKSYLSNFKIGAMEINYLDKRTPWLSLVWSMLMPGMGQLYIHRIVTAFYVLSGWIWISYVSRLLEGFQFTWMGEFDKAAHIVNPEWLLFLPSLYGFAVYDAYTNTVENNKLFDKEQKRFLITNYQERKDEGMRIISSFDHSNYLELALSALEACGIEKNQILAVPLNKRAEKPKMFDTMHRSDGVSLLDTAMVCATVFTVVFSSVGFIWKWGPIIWGLIGAMAGFIVGLIIDLIFKRKQPRPIKGKSTEVFVMVECKEHQLETVEHILWKHMAFGVAIIR